MYNKEALEEKLKQIKDNFYATLDSWKLVKRHKVPFVEHLSLVNAKLIELPDKAEIHDDLKWELVFYNVTLEDAK